jgi:hypothetical protein
MKSGQEQGDAKLLLENTNFHLWDLSAKLTKKISMGMSFQISEFYFTFC